MKKFLVVLLSAMMVFAFATTAFAAGQFTDIADLSKESQDAISKLSALEIIGGYPDGTFKPSNTITRAEFAKMACVAGGMAESADILGGTTSQFSDVKANEWYTGYINLAVSQGYVKGYPDGTFKPNNTITNAEVITVIMRILGYNDNLPGPWPVDYVAKAGNLEITTGIVTSTNANAVRGDVARMIDNALDENVVVWNNDIDDFDDKYREETSLLEESFKGQTTEDRTVADWSVDSFSKGNLRIALNSVDNATGSDKENGFVVTDATVISGGYTLYNINDMIVDVIFKEDKDLNKLVAKYIDVKSTKVQATKVARDGNGKVKVGDKTYSTKGTLDYTNIQDAQGNFVKNTFFTAYVDEDNLVYKVKNDQNPASKSYVVDEYVASAQRIETYNGNVSLKGDDVMLFDQNGKAIEPTDLKNKDIIKVYDDARGDADQVIFVEDWKEATMTSADGNKINFEGTSYLDNATFFDDDEDYDSLDKDYIGTKVQYALDAANKVIGVIYTESGLGNNVYGVVVNASADRSFTAEGGMETMYFTTLTLFNQDGKTVKYDVEDEEIRFLEGDKVDSADEDDYNAGEAALLRAGQLVKVRLTKDGEVHRIYAPGAEDAKGNVIGAQSNKTFKEDGITVIDNGLEAEVETKNEHITLAGNLYSVPNNIAAFNIDMDTATKVDTVELITKANLLSGDVKGKDQAKGIDAIQFILDADGDLMAIAVNDFSSSGNAHFGFVKTLDVVTSDIDDGIKFWDDSTVYEVAQSVAKDGFYRYDISGEKVTFVANMYQGEALAKDATKSAIELKFDTKEYIKTVQGGIYTTSANTRFTVEDGTDIFEVTLDADGEIYDIEKVSSVSKGDTVIVQTRADANQFAGDAGKPTDSLDTAEAKEAEFVIVITKAVNSDKDKEDNDAQIKDLKEAVTGAKNKAQFNSYSPKAETIDLGGTTFDVGNVTVIDNTDATKPVKATIDDLFDNALGQEVSYSTKGGAINVIVYPANAD